MIARQYKTEADAFPLNKAGHTAATGTVLLKM